MIRRILAAGCGVVAAAALCVLATPASADTPGVVALGFGSSGWLYQQEAETAPYDQNALVGTGDATFAQPGADTSGFSTGGVAPFGNSATCGTHAATSWSANTDMLLRHDITLPPGAYDVHVTGTVDNDASVFFNGQNVGVSLSGFCQTNSISMSVPQQLVDWYHPNLLAIRAHDYGAGTFLDVQVTYTQDTTPPILSGIPGDITATATGSGGAVVDWTLPTATDAVDPDPTVICNNNPGDTYALGTTVVICVATDAAGNSSMQSFSITVTYAWCGVLQPINTDGTSVFKLGSTVPVKFCLSGASAGVTDALARLSYAKVSDSVDGDYTEATSTAAATTGNLFRYDPTAGQYVFNLATKGLTAGTYVLEIDLGDDALHTVEISLR